MFNYDINLFMCGTFLIRLLPPTDKRGLPTNSNETYGLNLSAVTLSIWSFCISTARFCTMNCTILGSLPSSQLWLIFNFQHRKFLHAMGHGQHAKLRILAETLVQIWDFEPCSKSLSFCHCNWNRIQKVLDSKRNTNPLNYSSSDSVPNGKSCTLSRWRTVSKQRWIYSLLHLEDHFLILKTHSMI